MLQLAERIAKLVADATLGTMIVVVHVAIADRSTRTQSPVRRMMADGSRSWESQISP